MKGSMRVSLKLLAAKCSKSDEGMQAWAHRSVGMQCEVWPLGYLLIKKNSVYLMRQKNQWKGIKGREASQDNIPYGSILNRFD